MILCHFLFTTETYHKRWKGHWKPWRWNRCKRKNWKDLGEIGQGHWNYANKNKEHVKNYNTICHFNKFYAWFAYYKKENKTCTDHISLMFSLISGNVVLPYPYEGGHEKYRPRNPIPPDKINSAQGPKARGWNWFLRVVLDFEGGIFYASPNERGMVMALPYD